MHENGDQNGGQDGLFEMESTTSRAKREADELEAAIQGRSRAEAEQREGAAQARAAEVAVLPAKERLAATVERIRERIQGHDVGINGQVSEARRAETSSDLINTPASVAGAEALAAPGLTAQETAAAERRAAYDVRIAAQTAVTESVLGPLREQGILPPKGAPSVRAQRNIDEARARVEAAKRLADHSE